MSVRSVLVRYMGDPSGAVAAARTTAAANASVASTAKTANARTAGMGRASRTAASGLGVLNPKILGPAGLVLGLKHAVSAQGDFADATLRMRTQIGLTAQEADTLADASREVGTAYGVGAQAAVDASWQIASAGLRGEDASEALERSAMAAAVGFGDMTTVADLTTSAMNAYGAESLSAERATDILAAAVREGKAEPEELAASMGQVLPIASEMGVEFEELAGVVAAMTRTGTNASTANIQMRQVLMDLLNPTQQAREALDEVGLSAEGLRASIQDEGLFPTLMTLREAFKDNQEGMSEVFSNARSLMGVLDLLGSNVGENEQIIARMSDSTGDLSDAFADLEENSVGFQWNKLKANLQDAVLGTGDLASAWREVMQFANEWLEFDPSKPFDSVGSGARTLLAPPSAAQAVVGAIENPLLRSMSADPEVETRAAQAQIKALEELAVAGDKVARETLRDLIGGHEGWRTATIRSVESTLEATARGRDMGETFGGAAAEVNRGSRDIVGQLGNIPGPLAEVDGGMVDLAASTDEVTVEFIEFMVAMQDWVGGALDADSAAIAFQDSLVKISEAAEETGGGIDIATESGRRNREAVIGATEALWGEIDARMEAGESIGDLLPLIHEHVDAMKEEMSAAGLTDDEINELVDTYGLIPADIMTRIRADDRASSVLRNIKGQLDRLPRSFDIRASVSGMTASQLQNIGLRASGGPVSAGRPYIVGEQGPELIVPRGAGTVIPAGSTAQMMRAPAGMGGDGAAAPAGAGKIDMHVQAWSERFSLSQIKDELAMHGAV